MTTKVYVQCARVLSHTGSAQSHRIRFFAILWTPGKNTGVGCHFLLQGIFLPKGLNPCLLYCWGPE